MRTKFSVGRPGAIPMRIVCEKMIQMVYRLLFGSRALKCFEYVSVARFVILPTICLRSLCVFHVEMNDINLIKITNWNALQRIAFDFLEQIDLI